MVRWFEVCEEDSESRLRRVRHIISSTIPLVSPCSGAQTKHAQVQSMGTPSVSHNRKETQMRFER